MKYCLIFLCFFYMLQISFAENLSKKPIWTIETLGNHILMIECNTLTRTDQIYEIQATVYTLNGHPLKKRRICEYEKIFICGEAISDLTFNEQKCKKPYKIFIYTKTGQIDINKIFSSNAININYEIVPKDGKESYFFPDNLNTLTLGTRIPGIPKAAEKKFNTDYLCDAYFDSKGYAYLQYSETKQCDKSPKNPFSPGSEKKTLSEDLDNEASSNRPDEIVKIDSKTYVYNKIFGYVPVDRYFINTSYMKKDQGSLITVAYRKKDKKIAYSPVWIDKHGVWFYFSFFPDYFIMFENNNPTFLCMNNLFGNLRQAFEVKKIKKFFVLQSSETYQLLEKHISLKKKLSTLDYSIAPIMEAKDYYTKMNIHLNNTDLNTFHYNDQFKRYEIYSENGNFAFIDNEYYLEKIDNCWNVRSTKKDFPKLEINIPKMTQSEKFEQGELRGKKYYKTPVHGYENEYIFEIFEPKVKYPFQKGKHFLDTTETN